MTMPVAEPPPPPDERAPATGLADTEDGAEPSGEDEVAPALGAMTMESLTDAESLTTDGTGEPAVVEANGGADGLLSPPAA
jgi:hypothetical protein